MQVNSTVYENNLIIFIFHFLLRAQEGDDDNSGAGAAGGISPAGNALDRGGEKAKDAVIQQQIL